MADNLKMICINRKSRTNLIQNISLFKYNAINITIINKCKKIIFRFLRAALVKMLMSIGLYLNTIVLSV